MCSRDCAVYHRMQIFPVPNIRPGPRYPSRQVSSYAGSRAGRWQLPGIAIPSSAILEVHNTGSGRQKCGCCWWTQSAATQSQRPEDQRKCYGMPYLCECSTARVQDLGSLGMPRWASQGCCCGCCSAPGNVDVPDRATLEKASMSQ
jgi:hypothetical protein